MKKVTHFSLAKQIDSDFLLLVVCLSFKCKNIQSCPGAGVVDKRFLVVEISRFVENSSKTTATERS